MVYICYKKHFKVELTAGFEFFWKVKYFVKRSLGLQYVFISSIRIYFYSSKAALNVMRGYVWEVWSIETAEIER